MLKPFFIPLLLCLTILFQPSIQFKIQLPISQLTLAKLTLSIDRLERLLASFNTKLENKVQIYRRVQLTKGYLDELRAELSRFNNVVAGKGNAVDGRKNIVIGNYNKVEGDNNWVFVSKFGGRINGVLLVGEWMIELQKSQFILKSPRLAISYIDQQKNVALRQKYGANYRQLAKWDTWTHPDNKEADKHWGRYLGYKEWKVTNWDRKNLRVDLENSNSWSWKSDRTTSGWTGSAVSSNTGSWSSSLKPTSIGGGTNNLSKTNTRAVQSGGTSNNTPTSNNGQGTNNSGWAVGQATNNFNKLVRGWSSGK